MRGFRVLALLLGLGSVASLRAQGAGPGRPLSLEEALRLARPASEPVGLARAAVTRARGQQFQARSDRFPQLTGSASYSRLLESQYSALSSTIGTDSTGGSRPTSCDRFFSNPSLPIGARVDSLEKSLECVSSVNPFGALGSLPFGRANTYNLGLSASQTLFAGGRVRAQIRTANAGRRSAELALSAAEAQLTLDVVQTYFDAALADQLSRIARSALDQADSTLKETELKRSVGNLPEFDLLRARVSRDNQRAAAIQSAYNRDLAMLRLRQLLELPVSQELTLTTSLDDSTLAGAPTLQALIATPGDTVTEHRAPVRQAVEAVSAQEGLLQVSRAQQFPTVALTSAYGRVAYPTSGLPGWNDFLTNWSVAVGLQVPIFTGGRIKGDKLVARAGLDEARLRLRQATESAQLDAQNTLNGLSSSLEALSASRGTTEQAERAYQIAEIRYREGISTHTELLDARLALEQARSLRASAARDAQIARVRVALLAQLPLAGGGVGAASPAPSNQRTAAPTQASATSGSGIP